MCTCDRRGSRRCRPHGDLSNARTHRGGGSALSERHGITDRHQHLRLDGSDGTGGQCRDRGDRRQPARYQTAGPWDRIGGLVTTPPARRGGWSEADREREHELLARLAALPPDDDARGPIRDELVTMHLPLVHHLARRFRDRGEPHDDLVQVGTIGLIKAVDRFDPQRGVEFSTYATPTVLGEIKRHFRDKGWSVRVPRRLQELRLAITRATAELSQDLGRSPTVKELAARLEVTEEEVLEGLEAAQSYSTLSLDGSAGDSDGESPALVDTLGSDDAALENVEYRETLRPLLDALPPRERQIVLLRFFHNKTQSEIAAEVGVSQMHVSRLLVKALGTLRGAMGVDA
ncbi:MAG: RNA polymerase sigma factor SigF [Actinobacteria bacterium]|nr:RNA polymerase sigma factor SigF [Actinomycetota bacterium]MCB8997138.1 RNA polymerase sigma factor SigF [Actinomycetota bacterium]